MQEMTKAQIAEKLLQIGINSEQEQLRTEIFHVGGLVFKGETTIEEALSKMPDEALRKKWRPILFAHILRSMVLVWSEQTRIPPKLLEEIMAFLLEIAYPPEDISS